MELVDLSRRSDAALEQAARMLVEEFVEPSGWSDLDEARQELTDLLSTGFARGMIRGEQLLGWVAAQLCTISVASILFYSTRSSDTS